MITYPNGPIVGPGPAVLAVDVGGTQIKAAVLDRSGRLTGVSRRPTPRSTSDPGGVVVEAVLNVLNEVRPTSAPIEAVGLTIPGIVEESSGRGVWSANLGWRDYPFADLLTARTGMPTAVAHDVRAAGEAEARLGAARGFDDAAVIAIGTGVAAALRVGGRAYTGRGSAGEIGHLVVDPSGPLCACGQIGCLEAIASAAAILHRYQVHGSRPVASAADVLGLLALGDSVAVEIWDSALSALGIALSHLVAIMAPEVIVMGGGLAEAGATLLDPLREQLTLRCPGLAVPPVVKAELGEDAGTWGAAILARGALG